MNFSELINVIEFIRNKVASDFQAALAYLDTQVV